MMLLKSIRLKNIRSYADEKIDFPGGTVLLSGDIGCGKSTILMAIDFAIFGLRKGELSGSDLLRHGKDDGFVELEFALDGKHLKIKRSLKRNNAISQDSCFLTINGLTQNLTALELKARLLEMLGYPHEFVKKNKPIFRYTVYTPQEEMKNIMLDEDERLDTLRKIFNIDKYGTIRSNARMFLGELRSMKREFDAYSRDLESKMLERSENFSLSDKIAGEIRTMREKLSDVSVQYEAKLNLIDSMKKEMIEYRAVQLSLAKKESETRSMRKRIEDLEMEISNIETKIQFNINLMTETVEGDIESLMKAIRILETDRDGMLRNVAVIDTEVDKLTNIYSKGVCSFCGQLVADPESFSSHINERRQKRAEIFEGINQTDIRLEEIKQKKALLEKYNTIKRTVDDLKSWRVDKQNDMARLNSNLKELEDNVIELKTRCSKYINIETDYNKSESELFALQKNMLELEKSLSRSEQQKSDIEKRLHALEKEIYEKQASREKSGKITSLLDWFEKFIMLMENIEKHVLLTVQKEFDQYFQYWFSILMGDSLSVRIDEKFSPLIEQNGYETSFENLSGGEKTAVSLAYRLALNKVINIMIETIRTKDLLILDEPTDGFSTEQLDRVRDVINALGLKQIILVSHEPKIDTYVENVIKVYKENHISRIVVD